MTSSWFFLSTLNYDARSTTHQMRFVSPSRKFHDEELNDLYSSSNNVRVIKSRRMRLAGYIARMGRVDMYIQGFGGET